MKSNPEPTTQEVLAGLVERITFHNAENGFCVLRAKARGHRDLVTVVVARPITKRSMSPRMRFCEAARSGDSLRRASATRVSASAAGTRSPANIGDRTVPQRDAI